MKKIGIAVLAGTALLLFVGFGPPDVVHKTSSPEFCVTCHAMADQHDAWQKSALHRHLKCVDCHLPNNNKVNHLVWKSIDGTKDLVMNTLGMIGDPIGISGHGAGVAQANCVRCHGHMASHVNTTERNCWSCHRRVSHRVAPMETRLIELQ